MKKFLWLFALSPLLFVLPAVADDKAEKAPEQKNEVLEAAGDFMKELDDTNRRHFNVLFGNHNMIRVVETVRDDIGLAVDACGEANPDLKGALNDRYKDWKAAIKPVLAEADGNVKNMIIAQDYAKPKKIRDFLKMIDKARKTQEKQVEKVPVTSQEACQSLLNSMNDTEANMIQLLRTTLISLPQAMQEEDRIAREKAEADAKAKAEEEAEKEKEADDESAEDDAADDE